MDFLISAIAFILIFSAIILIHEFGHFYVARKMGIKVEEFGIGLPPRIFGKKIKGVLYSVNWIPFGGFVRLYGEDSFDPKILKSKDSFAGKPLLARMAVVVAGVFMNFILAFTLLAIGFTIGIEPLIVNSDDIFSAIEENTIELNQGLQVKDVREGTPAFEAGILAGDIIVNVNGSEFYEFEQLQEEKDVNLEVFREGIVYEIPVKYKKEISEYGLEFYDFFPFPRVYIEDVVADSDMQRGGLQEGDVIIRMNNKPVYSFEEFKTVLENETTVEFTFVRNSRVENRTVAFEKSPGNFIEEESYVQITDVIEGMPAKSAGFQRNDQLISINDTIISSKEDSIAYTSEHIEEELIFKVKRNGQLISLNVKPSDDGKIGVRLFNKRTFKNDQLTVYQSDYITSLTKIHDVKYPFPQSMGKALTESGRLAVLTAAMFGNVVKSIVTQFSVPEGVAGPVGIASLTHVFVQKGIWSLLRFAALLSLSLAVINIIPFPALDGGRLLFLLVEAVRRKRVPPKWEASIHALGFVLLIGLIFVITYSDILNIFN